MRRAAAGTRNARPRAETRVELARRGDERRFAGMTRHSAAEQKRKYETNRRSAPSPLFGSIKLTHADRKVFPDGRSKGDVAQYYAAVMPYLLAALANRPLSVVRCPDGISAACFFQKH